MYLLFSIVKRNIYYGELGEVKILQIFLKKATFSMCHILQKQAPRFGEWAKFAK